MSLPDLPPNSKPQIIHQTDQSIKQPARYQIDRKLLADSQQSQKVKTETKSKSETVTKSETSTHTNKLPEKKTQNLTYSTKTLGWKVFTPPDGPIAQIKIPIDWRKSYERSPDTMFQVYETTLELSPHNHPEVSLVFGYANLLNKPEIQALNALLSRQLTEKQPHALTDGEMKSLGRIIGRTADPQSFELRHLFTCTFSGVPVVFAEGQFKSSGACGMCMTMLSDVDGPPLDLNLEAPENPHAPEAESKENLYAHYRGIAMQIFNSIVWRKDYAARFSARAGTSGE